MIKLDEGSDNFKDIKDQWKEKAKKSTIETLPSFLKELTEEYQHDYGTICHATALAAIAAAWSVNASSQGGITGFQAGAVMWEFIRNWNYSSNKAGLRIVDYDNFLYPQYEESFEKTISTSVWEALKNQAQEQINEANSKHKKYETDLKQYEVDIAEFVTKYPDYYDNKEHYDHLGMGTGDQWEQEEKKKESGFEFAPDKPYEPINRDSPVYAHWASIVDGRIPFGHVISDDS